VSTSFHQFDNPASGQRSGADEYLRVLFPRSWEVTSERGRNEESRIATNICRSLWTARERARLDAGDASVRRERVSIDGCYGLGEVTAIVCLDCLWVAWDDRVAHPWACLGVPQEPDIKAGMGAIRVGRTSAQMGSEPWGPYFDALFPKALVRDFVQWKRSSTGVRIARRFWEQREQMRSANASVPSAQASGAHIGVVLDAVREIAHAACLTCTWLDARGLSMGNPNWRALAATIARQHELNGNE
jgi:hypothetical protein